MAEIIVALDLPEGGEALELVDRLGPLGGFYKVGLELFTREGPPIVRALRERGKRVFLDLKLHDIPNTVAAAVRAATRLDVELLTVHAVGGAAMMEGAARAARGSGMRLLGVTVLTSLDAGALRDSWGRRDAVQVEEEVVRLGRDARRAGLHGLVASPREARSLRGALDEETLLVIPGIRPPDMDHHDQTRVATPEVAVEAGADYLVVGRAVTRAPDPRRALDTMVEQVHVAHGRGQAP